MSHINKLIEVFGQKFAHANIIGNSPEERAALNTLASLGRTAKQRGPMPGANKVGELHWNGWDPSRKQAHIEYWHTVKEKLVANKCHGVKSLDDNLNCKWAANDFSVTLDQAVNNVPDWLGSVVIGHILSDQELNNLIISNIG